MLTTISLFSSNVSRKQGGSAVGAYSYASGQKFRDSHTGITYYSSGRTDVISYGLILPPSAPKSFEDPQLFFDAWNQAEKRKDASMGHKHRIALPNELSAEQQVEVVMEFIHKNFTKAGYPALYAFHSGKADEHVKPASIEAPHQREDNPHVHIIASARKVDEHGFQATKLDGRATYKREFLLALRKSWADHLNATFERLGLEVRVDYRSYKDREIDQLPTPHIGPKAMALEMRGVKTAVGDRYRNTIQRNRMREAQRLRNADYERTAELELER